MTENNFWTKKAGWFSVLVSSCLGLWPFQLHTVQYSWWPTFYFQSEEGDPERKAKSPGLAYNVGLCDVDPPVASLVQFCVSARASWVLQETSSKCWDRWVHQEAGCDALKGQPWDPGSLVPSDHCFTAGILRTDWLITPVLDRRPQDMDSTAGVLGIPWNWKTWRIRNPSLQAEWKLVKGIKWTASENQ